MAGLGNEMPDGLQGEDLGGVPAETSTTPDPDPQPGVFAVTIPMGRGLVTDTMRLTAGDGPVRLSYFADQPLPEGVAAQLHLRKGVTLTSVTGSVLYGPDGLVVAVVETVPPAGDYLLSWEVAGVHFPQGFPVRVSIAAQVEAP